ncbi:hypothetical protein DH2020_006416 [Rehmannia glutinosa]|uniref:Protein YIP n=1 Tax=Rehmannia glutinosa TaxID=99300 RepID=A0ABR0XIV6_REHGL
MSYSDTIPLHPSSQSDIDEIENLINSNPSSVLPARPPSPPRASIPVSSAPSPPPPSFIPSNLPPPAAPKPTPVHSVAPKIPTVAASTAPPRGSTSTSGGIAASGFGSPPNTLTEPVWDTVKRDLSRIVSNLKLVVFPNPYREDPGKALRDWDLWGPFFFIVFLGLTLSWSASVKKVSRKSLFQDAVKVAFCFALTDHDYALVDRDQESDEDGSESEVFAVAFALLAAGAIILTLNVLLLGGHIIFFQSLSLLGYCLFPLDIGALICMLKDNVIVKVVVVAVTLAWSSWAAYPFMSTAVNPRRKALALYPVLLMYVSVGFLIIAID